MFVVLPEMVDECDSRRSVKMCRIHGTVSRHMAAEDVVAGLLEVLGCCGCQVAEEQTCIYCVASICDMDQSQVNKIGQRPRDEWMSFSLEHEGAETLMLDVSALVT